MANNSRMVYLDRRNRQGVMAGLVLLGLGTALPGLAGVDMQEVLILT